MLNFRSIERLNELAVASILVLLLSWCVWFFVNYFTPESTLKHILFSQKSISELSKVNSDPVEVNNFYRFHYSYNLAKYVAKQYYGVDLVYGREGTGNLVKGSSLSSEIQSYAGLYVMTQPVALKGVSPGQYFIRYLKENRETLIKYNDIEEIEAAINKKPDEHEINAYSQPSLYFFDIADDSMVLLMAGDLRIPLPLTKAEMDLMLGNLQESFEKALNNS